jgi:hypothetical protein
MAEPTRYCDLVMKGGLTSGLVYPQTVLKLSDRYRFRNIGGTSVGAIAAAICAAAALGERVKAAGPAPGDADRAGMAGLRRVAADLTREDFVFGLFQPSRAGRAPYRLITRLVARPGRLRTAFEIALALVRLAPLVMLATLAVLLAIAWLAAGTRGIWAAALPSLACAAALGAVRAALATGATISGNFLGLCSGVAQSECGPDALTEWMHRTIREVAGAGDPAGPPILFRELWEAPLYPDETDLGRRINLQIITTDVSHSEPRTLPFAKGGFWFREDEFLRLFPPAVVESMTRLAPSSHVHDGVTYWAFPEAGDVPVVVAARMSLSFPLLISAVPLHEPDFRNRPARAERAAGKGERPRLAESMNALASGGAAAPATADDLAGVPMRRCWFTDGGVSSNFPVHLFDAPLPRWPTFAIDLVYSKTEVKPDEAILLPKNNNQGLRPRFSEITGGGGLGDIVRFLVGIVGTMQNWRDLIQGRAPGHRDRIVRVVLDPSEGGMNLRMPGPTLVAVAQKGGQAGEALLGFDFDNHFWVRYRNAASAIERFTFSFAGGLAPPLTPDCQAAWDRMWKPARTAGSYPFKAAQAKEARARLDSIQAAAQKWKAAPADLTEGAPEPLPQLRIVPIF